MSPEIRREVKASSRFLEKLDRYYGSSTHKILLREVIPYIFEVFRQDWDTFDVVLEDEPRIKYYEYLGDEIPHAYFMGQLVSVSATDPFYIVEIIELTDVIMTFTEEDLEDPEDPTPNR